MSRSANPRLPFLRVRRPAGGVRVAVALLLACLLSAPAAGLDGRLEYRDTSQDGSSGADDYSLRIRRQEFNASQNSAFGPHAALRMNLGAIKEYSDSRTGPVESGWDKLTQRGGLSFRVGSKQIRFSVDGSGSHRETDNSNADATVQDRVEFSSWVNVTLGQLLRVQSSLQQSRSWQQTGSNPENENRQFVIGANTDSQIPHFGEVRYSLSRLDREAVNLGTHGVETSHSLAYLASRGFAGNRGKIGLEARTRYFTQNNVTAAQPEQTNLLLPLSGGYVVDGTPELNDPLEDELIPVSSLFDRDRLSQTEIDLGDDAEVGWQFGGDYRNVQADFGEPVEMSGAFLFVDRALSLPGFMQWRVFVSDEQEGRVWEELGSAGFTAAYVEESNGLQGWRFSFSAGLSSRFVKFVNVKLGPTEPVLFVTELEIYSRTQPADTETRDSSRNHRAQLDASYRLGHNVNVRYDLAWRLRERGEAPDLSENSQGVSLGWRPGAWSMSARYEIHRVGTRLRDNTNARNLSLNLARRWSRKITVSAGWYQSRDESALSNRITNSLSGDGRWQIAPGLSIVQKVGYSWLDDRSQMQNSTAMTMNSRIQSDPFRWLTVDVSRTDRWSERGAGLGFTNHNDTDLNVIYAPWPFVSLRSNVRYQARGESDWYVYNSISWAPLQGGDLAVRFSGNQQSDTRSDSSQRGAGVSLAWKPRRSLVVEGGVNTQFFEVAGEQRSPLNTNLRVALSF